MVTCKKSGQRSCYSSGWRRNMAEDLRQITVNTYNQSAEKFVEYFAGIGSREEDINRAFELAGHPQNPSVLELGCGDGRDAKVILERTNRYRGTDISEAFISLARQNVPNGRFEVADMVDDTYSEELDIVFAFASLLHL